MSAEPVPFEALLGPDVKACCVSAYEAEAVQWLLDGQLHPGGEALTLRTAQLAGVGAGDHVLDVASGRGATALLLGRELGARVTGVELSATAVAAAQAEAAAAGLFRQVRFAVGDAEELPFAAHSFDAVVCECSLCTFPDKEAAVAEMGRVLRGRGRIVIADVTAETERLPPPLRSAAARAACIAGALPVTGYASLLERAGLVVVACESHDRELAAMIDRVEARLRVARMLRVPQLRPYREEMGAAIALARLARRAASDGTLGYSVIVAAANA